MFTHFRQAYSVFFDIESWDSKKVLEKNNTTEFPRWIDSGDGTDTPPDYRAKVEQAKTNSKKDAMRNLERVSSEESVRHADVWPPDTMNELEKSKPTSSAIAHERNTTQSQLLTHIYTKLSDQLVEYGVEKSLSVTIAANYMRTHSEEIQKLIANNTDPKILKQEIRKSIRTYLKSEWVSEQIPEEARAKIAADPRNNEVSKDASNGASQWDQWGMNPERDNELDGVIAKYDQVYQKVDTYQRNNNGIDPDEVEKGRLSDDHLMEYRINNEDYTKVLEESSIDTAESIVTGVGVWKTAKIQFDDESGISEVLCTHTQTGDYILKFPTGESILIDSNGDPEKAKKEIAFIQEVAKTPIIRRLLMNGNEKFQTFRQQFEKQFPWQEIDTNPVLFTRRVLERIVSKIPDEGLTDPQKTLKDQLTTLCTPDVSLSRIQEFLRNKRDQLTPMLHKAGLIPQDGVQKLFTEKLL